MHTILEFPAKVFVQWGAIAQEIVPYLAQRGVKRDEIGAVLARLRARWEQQDPALSDTTGAAWPEDAATHLSCQLEEDESYVSRHWKSQPARMLIESAMLDHQRHICR